jgi:hypothetical protein
MAEQDTDIGTKNDALLKRIRERYTYAMDKWRRNRTEGQKNMRYVSGDPWDDEDRNARKQRPTVCADQLNQFVNQVVNTARQNPRGIIVDPAGDGATEQLAEYRENRIRAIEYGSNAAQAYINGLQAATERNIGYWKVGRIFVSDETDEQEIVILPILNPDAILIDPDYKELDASDIKWAFELDKLTLEEFEREYPDAEKRSFAADDFGGDESNWFDGKSIVVASYWEIQTSQKTVGKRKRTAEIKAIQQYVTNGVEILRKADPQPGPYIPLVPCFGKEIWVEYGKGGAERVLLSLVSLARDPQKALAYVMSAMLENVGQLPKTSFIGAVGQFETDEEAWKTVNSVFHPYLQYDVMVDQASGQPLPAPQRTPQTPDFQAYAVGVDICQRAVQSAMGLQALPSAAQRSNQKSGVALQKIQSEQAIGSYHLVDNYDRAIKLTGRIVNNWLSLVDLGEIEKPIRESDGSHKLAKINTDEAVMEGDHEYHFPIADDKGRYQVTISSGPSHESQREEASEFVDTVVQNLKNLPLSPPQAAQVLSLGIKLKQLGPLGDQMAEIVNPQNQGQGQQLQAMQQQMGMMQQQQGQMQALIQKLMLERQGKVIEQQGKASIVKMQEDTKLAVAQMNSSKDANESIADREIQVYDLLHNAAHETAMQAQDQAHQQGMAQQQQAAAAQQQQAAAQQAAQQSQEPANPTQQ